MRGIVLKSLDMLELKQACFIGAIFPVILALGSQRRRTFPLLFLRESMPDCIADKLGIVLETQLLHQPHLVGTDCLGAER